MFVLANWTLNYYATSLRAYIHNCIIQWPEGVKIFVSLEEVASRVTGGTSRKTCTEGGAES